MHAPTDVLVNLTIENAYPDSTAITTVGNAAIAAPADHSDDALNDWALEHLFPFTGTEREDGDSLYVVTVTTSSDPRLAGRRFEIG